MNSYIKKVHSQLIKKEISVVELTKQHIALAEQYEPDYNAFLHLDKKRALFYAQILDDTIKKGERINLLTGIPVGVKDNILVKGMPATAGSAILKNYQAAYSATVIERLEAEGAIILGKTNLDAFGMGSSTEHSDFGVTRNAHDRERVAGGSSGGSATAVALQEVVYALGTDTGGSIRQPAAFNGVIGLKPTYGSVSRFGLIALASSLDVIGPIAQSVDDVELVFNAIAGLDSYDATTYTTYSTEKNLVEYDKLRVGLVRDHFSEGLDSKIKEKTLKFIDKLASLRNVEIEEVELPHIKAALAAYYIIMPAEASSNLARYDGIRYGTASRGKTVLERYLNTRAENFGDEVKRRVVLGTFTLAAGYYDAYYEQAQRMRSAISVDFEKVFSKSDLLLGPVTPTTAFRIGEKSGDPLEMYLQDLYTVPVNLAGLPALSIPIGKINKLPFGLQIVASHNCENILFSFGRLIEKIAQYE